MREILEIVVPLVLPTLLYLLWVVVVRRAGLGGATAWQGMPFLWLAGAGVVLLALFLFVVTVHYGTDRPGIYVPPQYKNGGVVPGHFLPARKP